MNIRTIPAAIALSAFAFAAFAQTGGSMSGPGGSSSHMAAPAGCTTSQNHMAGGAMASSDHMAGGDHMTGGAMASGEHMSGGAMAGGNHMAANTTGCPDQKPK